MSSKNDSTRRSFLKGGALLAVPLAAAVPAAVMADDGLQARLAKLEDEAAIRKLHQSWLQRVNTGADAVAPLFPESDVAASGSAVRGIAPIAPGHAAQPDAIELAPGARRATARFHCDVEIETPIAQDCTLAQMAHAQGNGFVRRTERRVLKVEYAKTSGEWSVAKAELAPL
jgi:hypothetical protein